MALVCHANVREPPRQEGNNVNSLSIRSIRQRLDDFFIHETIFEDLDAAHRARVLTCVLLISLLSTLAVSITFIYGAPQEVQALLLPINLVVGIAICGLLYILKKHGQVKFCCLVALSISLATTGFAITVTGGPNNSHATQLLFIPCLLSFIFGGVRWGSATLSISFIMLVVMLSAQLSGIEFRQISNDFFSNQGNFWMLLTNFVLASALAFSYEYTSVSLKRERDLEYGKYVELARKDPLTGLANRRLFDEALNSRIALYERMPSQPCFALCYLDLDKFKPINDTYGHDVGDEVLSVISRRLLSAQRGADFVGRQGGDEFLILFDGVQSTEAMCTLAARTLQLIREPISTHVGMLEIDGSLGFAAFPAHGRDAISLRTATDSAMYEAKRSRKGFEIYSP